MASSLCNRCITTAVKNTLRISSRRVSISPALWLSYSKKHLSKDEGTPNDWMSQAAKDYDGVGNPFPRISRELLTFSEDEVKSDFKLDLRSRSDEFSGEVSQTFIDPQVQEILKRLTGMTLDKIFQPRKEELSPPSYQLLTEVDYTKVYVIHSVVCLFVSAIFFH